MAANRCVTAQGKIVYTDAECESAGMKHQREVKSTLSVIEGPAATKPVDSKNPKSPAASKKLFKKSAQSPVLTFCYDPANARKDVSGGDIESAVAAAVGYWNAGCNVDFRYLGVCQGDPSRADRPADYKIWWDSWDDSLKVDASRLASEHAIARASPRIGINLNRDIEGYKFLRQYRRSVAHEFGHVVGIGHSPNREDVMFPGGMNGVPTESDLDTCNRAVEARFGVK